MVLVGRGRSKLCSMPFSVAHCFLLVCSSIRRGGMPNSSRTRSLRVRSIRRVASPSSSSPRSTSVRRYCSSERIACSRARRKASLRSSAGSSAGWGKDLKTRRLPSRSFARIWSGNSSTIRSCRRDRLLNQSIAIAQIEEPHAELHDASLWGYFAWAQNF